MKIISWNINSLRLRLTLLEKLINKHNPDIICLQETKVEDSSFPLAAISKLGFIFNYFSGQKSYNGVAILSKVPLQNIEIIDVLSKNHKRHIAALLPNDILLHNFYVPAGGDLADPQLNPHFDFKLKFIDWMSGHFTTNYRSSDPIIMLGDLNIAPLEHDVWSHKQLLSVVSHTEIEIEKLNNLQSGLGWIDSHRLFVPKQEKLYSWWSYRAQDPLKSDRGRRLDHIWTTPALKNKIKKATILKEFRQPALLGALTDKPSDHVPICLELYS